MDKIPYYIAYTHRENQSGNTYREINARLSPNFMRYYNITIENTWKDNDFSSENYINGLFQATYGRMRINGHMQYQTNPSQYLHDYGAFAEYR